MRGQVHFLPFQRTNDFIPIRRVMICAVHMKIRSIYLTVNLYVHTFNKELTLLNVGGDTAKDVILPLRTLPSDESKFYLFNWLLEMSTGWRRDGKPAALGKSRTDVTRESLPIFVVFFF